MVVVEIIGNFAHNIGIAVCSRKKVAREKAMCQLSPEAPTKRFNTQ